MAKNAQAEMVMIGLQDEGGMVDEESGNEVPNGALKEEVRDDQPAMLSPGEFVIPAYAVRYIGVERLVGILREAKQGMEQLDDIGLTGEPNSDDAGLETAVLPSEMQAEGGMPMLAEGGVAGNVFRKPLPTQAKQTTFPTPAAAAVAPSPVVQAASSSPVRPQTNISYPQYVYSPEGGAGGGYGVEEYVGPDGQSIYVTTIGGKPLSKIPEDFVTRAKYTKQNKEKKDVPPTALKRKKEELPDPGTFEAPEAGDPDPFGMVAAANYEALATWAHGDDDTVPLSLIGLVGFIGKNIARENTTRWASKYLGKTGRPTDLDKKTKDMTKKEKKELVERAIKTRKYAAKAVSEGQLTGRPNQASNDSKNAATIALAIDAQTTAEGKEATAREGAGQYNITVDKSGGTVLPPTTYNAEAARAARTANLLDSPTEGNTTGGTTTTATAAALVDIAAAVAGINQNVTANTSAPTAPTNVSYPGPSLGSRSTAENIDVTANTSLGGRPDSVNAGGVSASADPTNPGASAGPPGMTAEDVAPPQSSTLLSSPGDVVSPGFEAPSVEAPSYDFGSIPANSFEAEAAGTAFAEYGGTLAKGGLIKVGDKTYGPEDFGFANTGAFVTKKKTRKRKKGKGLASSK